jgi:hypothetical protein
MFIIVLAMIQSLYANKDEAFRDVLGFMLFSNPLQERRVLTKLATVATE